MDQVNSLIRRLMMVSSRTNSQLWPNSKEELMMGHSQSCSLPLASMISHCGQGSRRSMVDHTVPTLLSTSSGAISQDSSHTTRLSGVPSVSKLCTTSQSLPRSSLEVSPSSPVTSSCRRPRTAQESWDTSDSADTLEVEKKSPLICHHPIA